MFLTLIEFACSGTGTSSLLCVFRNFCSVYYNIQYVTLLTKPTHTYAKFTIDLQEKTTDKVLTVPDPGEGVCVDPVNRGAILEGEGPGPPSGDKERQLSPDKGRGKM